MYKLLAIDIDGTLINFERPNISKRVKEAVRKAKESGTHVVLISGRNYYSMKRYLEDLDIKDFGITINGGIVVDLSNEENIIETYLDPTIARTMTKIFEKVDIPYAVFAGHYAYAPRKHEDNATVKLLAMEKDNVHIYDDTEDFLNTVKTNKYIAMAEIHKLEVAIKEIKERYEDEVFIEYGFTKHLEIYPKKMNKGIALTELAKKLKIPMSQVMAIGDAENDISMLKAAGFGVAMGNAFKHVKESANYITKTIEEDGVAHVIEEFILGDTEEYAG